MKPQFNQKHGLALSALIALMQSPAGAQVPDAGRALETVPAPPPLPLDNSPVLQGTQRPAAPRAPAGSARMKVNEFRFVGNRSLAAADLAAVVAPFTGRELGIEELQEAADAVRDRYRDAGFFLARALLVAQEVADGVVTLRIVEGAIGQVTSRLAPEARVSAARVDAYLGRLPRGTVITEQAVEQPLLLLSDLPGVQVNSVLRTGSGFGEADLDVAVSHDGRPVRGSAYLDNFGNRAPL